MTVSLPDDRTPPTAGDVRVIAIGGGSGAGKSTLSTNVQAIVSARSSCVIIPLEAYFCDWSHLPLAQRALVNFDEPAAIEVSRLVTDLQTLREGRPVERPWYDMTQHRRGDGTVLVEPASIIIVDGHLAFALDACLPLYDLKVFVDTAVNERLRRRLQRDVVDRGRTEQSVLDQWFRSVQPMYEKHIAPSAGRATLLVDGARDASLLAAEVIEAFGT